jgi:pyrroline-5-carboxylate reductase
MIGFIGGGNMAEALIRGMVDSGVKENIIVAEIREARRKELQQRYSKLEFANDDVDAAGKADIIVLAVKPQQMEEALNNIKNKVTPEKAIVSIAAGITLKYYQDRLKTEKIVRVMPNMGAFKGEGMSVMSFCDCFTGAEANRIKEIFMSSGHVLALPEKLMDAVTALSGSGPAFIALFIDAMIKAGQSLGLSPDASRELAVQTLKGTSALLEEDYEPGRLIEMVRSPGGTTAEGLKCFEEDGIYAIVLRALEAAARRSSELAR